MDMNEKEFQRLFDELYDKKYTRVASSLIMRIFFISSVMAGAATLYALLIHDAVILNATKFFLIAGGSVCGGIAIVAVLISTAQVIRKYSDKYGNG